MLKINQVFDAWFSRNFNATKCKTLLKLASSRMKLLKNKRDLQLKQMRRELAQTLESGQESKARIRVEHIIREQNIMEAYVILEHFCELIIVRIPILESQRECPLDLKEAVTSLIFAAPRVSDVPELLEVQTLFTFKYGRDFVVSATELQPECGVNRLVIEKLTTQAPSAKLKLEYMKQIAEEFNVDWDSSNIELEWAKSQEDLLDGSNQFLGHIQMSPIPLFVGASRSKEINTAVSDNGGLSLKPLENPIHEQHAYPLEDHESFSFVASAPQHETDSQPNRFYSPPRESSITKQSVLLEETLLHRSHSRTKSEGSMDLQDIIEAAEVAAESAEKAAQAARAAAELCRSQMSSRSKKDKLPAVGTLSSANPEGPPPRHPEGDWSPRHPEGGLKTYNYDWTDQNMTEREKQNGGINHPEQSLDNNVHENKGIGLPEQSLNSNVLENGHTYLESDDYDWTIQSYSNEDQEDKSLFFDPGSSQVDNSVCTLDGEADGSLYGLKQQGRISINTFDDGQDPQLGNHVMPHFDDSEAEKFWDPLLRQPSLEDDPVYTYPNLFSKSS
ncbi:hypothetical protein KP509_20G034500 [Ceratopteris richardii]|uniref:IST1-like protein n=1 Tax=Ceratopteris richardii TaxID=49495 RepID=A0A8T2SI82_CERRI|nr:hypothetical protein KP509_20G034500 [Ceratopteris richardii]